MNTQKKVKIGAIYGRVSLDDAADVENGSLEQQRHMGHAEAQKLTEMTNIHHVVKYELIEERGASGGNTNRPQYQRLLELVRTGKIEFIVAKEISRLSRSTQDFCEFMTLCQDRGVSVHIKGLEIDPNTPMGGAMFKMLAVIAELERQMIRERTRSSAISAAINNGKINGGVVSLGFDRDPKRAGFWIPNQEELRAVVRLMQIFNETLCYSQTLKAAKREGIKRKNGKDFGKDSLKRLLGNEKYIGVMTINTGKERKVVSVGHGCVVPVELYEKVQENIRLVEESVGSKNRNKTRVYPLSSLIEHEDGTAFSASSGTGRDGDLRFYYKNRKNGLSLSAPEIEVAVIESLKVFEDDEKMQGYAQQLQKSVFSKTDFLFGQIRKIRADLENVSVREKELVAKLSSASHDTPNALKWLDGQIKQFELERAALTVQLATLEREHELLKASDSDEKSLGKAIRRIFERLKKAPLEVQRGILRQILKKIVVVGNNKLRLVWAIPTDSPDGGDRVPGGRNPSYRLNWGD